MSGRKSISNTLIVNTIEDGYSVVAQYSPDKVVIHTTFQTGDIYMRTKSTEEGATWSPWQKVVGENGNETSYTYNISQKKTSTNAATPPSDCYYNTWQDAPVVATQQYPYLWMKVVKKTWNASTQSYDDGTPSYVRVTGEESVTYYIKGALPSIKMKAGEYSTAVRCVYSFYKKAAVNSEEEAVTCYYAVYLRSGTTFSLLTMASGYSNHGNGSSVDVRATVPYSSGNTVYDAMVIYTFATEYYSTNPEGQSYLARLEVPINKDGENSFVVDLDNEMTGIAVDKDGKTTYGTFVKLTPQSHQVPAVNGVADSIVNNWVRYDKYYYYIKPIGPDDSITDDLFESYTVGVSPEYWITDKWGTRRKAGNVHLVMDLMVQAIPAPVDKDGNILDNDDDEGYIRAWVKALGKSQPADLLDL